MTPDEIAGYAIDELMQKLSAGGLRAELARSLNGGLVLQDFLELDPSIQTLAKKIAVEKFSKRLVVEFAQELQSQMRAAAEFEYDTGHTQEARRKQFQDHIDDFINQNLGPFPFDPVELQNLAEKAAKAAKQIQEEYNLEPEEVLHLAKIALYDIVILCDNSGSMKIAKRRPALAQTLTSIAHWATQLEPRGIRIRFLNSDDDDSGRFDNLADLPEIEDRVNEAKLHGPTRLGTMLSKKIVKPMLEKIENGAADSRPLIAVVITDGEPTKEDEFTLKETIINCKTSAQLQQYGNAATIFIVCQVGDSERAKAFLSDLENDPDVGGMLYRPGGSLDEIIEKLEDGRDKNAYKRHMLRVFLSAVDGQSMPTQ